MVKIRIKADTNDGDYVFEESEITFEQAEKIKPLVDAIRRFEPYQGEWMPGQFTNHDHNFPYGECLREDMGEKHIYEIYSNIPKDSIELFEQLIPYNEYGIHTIESVEVFDGEETSQIRKILISFLKANKY